MTAATTATAQAIAPPAPPPPSAGPTAAAAPATSSYPPVIGDGSTARSRWRARWRVARWPLAVVIVLALVAGLLAITHPPTSGTDYATNNPGKRGGMALARVLGQRGVSVTSAGTVAAAVKTATPGSTLVVFNDWVLSTDQARAIADTGADLVLVSPGGDLLNLATHQPDATFDNFAPGYMADQPVGVDAECDDPDARAAQRITIDEFTAGTDPGVVACFPSPDRDGYFGYLVYTGEDRTVRVIADDNIIVNESIATNGHAALALRALGQHADLTWFVADYADDSLPGKPTSGGIGGGLMPPWTGVVELQLLLVLIVVAWWRGRRLGPLVTENLPVVVRAGETTRGRGRLYRRSRSRGHAAAGMRAATADRVAGRLGLPRSAAAPTLVDAAARATGRSADAVAQLFYGPPPPDDAALLQLARHLDQMESEVYRT